MTMRSISTLTGCALLACGPLTPPVEAASTTDAPATATPTTTTESPDPGTTAAPTTTTDPAPGTTSGQAFIFPPDFLSSDFECSVWSQDCSPGKKCAAWAESDVSWNSTKCVDVIGDGLPGDPCSTIGGGLSGMDDCAYGSMCWDVDENNHGTCTALCTGTPDAPVCPVGHDCAISGDNVLNLCLPGCDPLSQDCPGDDLCIVNGDSFLCVLDASGDEGQVNDPCELANTCDKGLICLDTATASAACQGSRSCCQPFCKFPDSPCPNPDQQCLPWFDPMMPHPEGHESIGICAIPK